MNFISRFKRGFAPTMEEEGILRIKKECKKIGAPMIVMGEPVRNIVRRTIDGLQCVLSPDRKPKRELEAEVLLSEALFFRKGSGGNQGDPN